MNRAELKAMAKEQIKGKIGTLFVITLIIAVVTVIGNVLGAFIPVVGSIAVTIFVSAPLAFSMVKIYLSIAAGNDVEAGDAFTGYSDFWGAFKVQFFVGLFTFLWSLLFYIPGIVKSFAYSMSMYILADNPGMGALEAIKKSKEMTNGHKMDLFVLGLSFIGWMLLISFTCGIAAIWVVPYMNTTYANVYKKLKAEYESKPAVEM